MIDNDLITTHLGDRLRGERDRLGYTQANFAGQVGINRMTQASYESGKRSPDAVYLAKARDLGVDVGFVLFNSRQGDSELLIETLEHLVMRLCDGLRIPPEKVEQAVTEARGLASDKSNHYQLLENIRLLASRLLRASATLNASVKILELDRDMLAGIIAGLERHATGNPVSPSQKALRVASLYRMFSEKGEIDQDLLESAARSLSRV